MRRILFAAWLLAGLAGCQQPLDRAAVLAFQRAQEAFDAARTPTEYLLAASQFQNLIDQGLESGAIYYNQGNAYMRGGQRGRAIACYRQAQRYRPRDPRLDANLQYALGGVPSHAGRPLLEYLMFWQDWVSYPGKFRVSVASGVLALALGLAALFLAGVWWRRAAAGVLAVTVLLAGSALYDWYRYEQVQRGVVTAREVTARKGNSDRYEPALTAALSEGTEFVVVEQRGDWLLVRLAGGQEVWLPSADAVTY